MRHILIAIICLLMTGGMHAQDIGMVLGSIEQNNASLKALREQNNANVAEAQSRNALQGLSVEYSPFFRSGYSGVSSSEFVASQEFESPGVYKQRRATTQAIKGAGEAEYALARRELLSEAQQLCFDLVALNKNRALLQQRLEVSERLSELYSKKYAAGDATALDINKIKLDCVARRTELDKNEAERAQIAGRLRVLNGGRALSLNLTEYPARHGAIMFDSLVAERLRQDAQLNSMRSQTKVAGSMLVEARRASLPKWSVGVRYNTEEGQGSTGVLVGVSLPLYSNRRQVRAAQARMQSAQLAEEQARIEMEGDMRSQAEAYISYERSLRNHDLDLLSESLRLLQKAVEVGEIPITEYYTEVDRIYDEYLIYNTLEHDSQIIHASIHKNEL